MKIQVLFIVAALSFTGMASLVYADGTVNITAKDSDGFTDAAIKLYHRGGQQNSGNRNKPWKLLEGRGGSQVFTHLKNGPKELKLKRPGEYKLEIKHQEGVNRATHTRIFELADGQTVNQDFYFPKATLNIIGTDSDGWAKAIFELYYKNDSQKWEPVKLKDNEPYAYLSGGVKTLQMPPGRYKIEIKHQEGANRAAETRIFDLADSQKFDLKFSFPEGKVNITTSSGTGRADATFSLFFQEDAGQTLHPNNKWQAVKLNQDISGNTKTLRIKPGRYKLVIREKASGARAVNIFDLADTQEISIAADFQPGSVTVETITANLASPISGKPSHGGPQHNPHQRPSVNSHILNRIDESLEAEINKLKKIVHAKYLGGLAELQSYVRSQNH